MWQWLSAFSVATSSRTFGFGAQFGSFSICLQEYPNFLTDGAKDNQKICYALVFVNEVHVGFNDVPIKECPDIMKAMETFDPTAVKDIKPKVNTVETGKINVGCMHDG